MIAHLSGTLRHKTPNSLVVDVHGVGYLVNIPFSTFYSIGEEGSKVDLHVHTHVREDAISMFGFFTLLEKWVFEELINVSGIGPKLATTILSGMSAEDLIHAIRHEQRAKLIMIPGLGKKTAERILLELKEKFKKKEFAIPEMSVPDRRFAEDIISALQNLGFRRAEAERAFEKAALRETDSFENALREALKVLTG